MFTTSIHNLILSQKSRPDPRGRGARRGLIKYVAELQNKYKMVSGKQRFINKISLNLDTIKDVQLANKQTNQKSSPFVAQIYLENRYLRVMARKRKAETVRIV